jgi:hypothetical protein
MTGTDALIYGVPSRAVWQVWPLAQRHIAAALVHAPRHRLAEVRDWCENRDAQLWVYGRPRDLATGFPKTVEAALVTKLVRHPDETDLRLLIFAFGADDLKEVLPLLAEVERLARLKDCKSVELRAPPRRRGWLRLLKGYSPIGAADGAFHLRKAL